MISINKVSQLYGGTQILWDLDLDIVPGSITCIMGRNGVGKTTLMKTIMGLLPIKSGEIRMGEDALHKQSAERRAYAGIGYVPQGRDIFPMLTVEENLRIGLPVRKSKEIPEKIFELFPVLKEMLHRRGGDLSGGQQQQLAIGRALVLEPKVLILDEPNEGIQPNIVKQIGDVILKLNAEEGLTVILIEQKLGFARRVGKEFRLMEKGRIVAADKMENLNDDLIKQYLAV
ncbi:High-affinity branched-chain amino acid transport ATP-binding protein LivF [Marinomonas gallaica]|uniref:High-affinity branched-chain amino acid transport ATP-binding protein LivF n=1 Tax=Marinomonas gallaica TaxID=1806667 RepID=A0A1C3JR32_9GAMM|nr:urea ABC transporter ATP-binding subunit UrtE [Marinomonas gallaica]MCO4784526.1 urea ABC transporter ATP-binding subunit UrtE [Marinomonas atlantica]SBT17663.1 High-affinity branched-chain amino acid transport ATP-binding protein LivF [Marinomonas gallaica]SBT19989.1 High-affinity branched-chain amino acid transport ATP-binding protein LivF [Marinomonas gallaica]